jgi:hypothetical protein
MTVKSDKNYADDIGKEFTCRRDDNDIHLSDNEDEGEIYL